MDWAHPRRAARDPLKGATLAARQSRFRGVLGEGSSLRRLPFDFQGSFQGVGAGISHTGSTGTDLKSAGETISRYSMSGE